MIVQSGAANVTVEMKHDSVRVSVGKIARLPKDIREEFNRRLEDGQPASEILPWVNALPVTVTILAKYFNGVPISEKNLSEWRQKGFQRWQEKQDSMAELKWLVEDAEDFSDATGGNVARIAVMKILRLLQTIPAEQASVNDLTKISHAISALLNADQNQARLEYEKTRVFQGNERLVLSWDKHLRGCIATAQRALNDAIAKDIQAANIDNSEKIELMGHHMFGKKWQGRKVGKKEVPKQEPEGPKKEPPKSAEEEKMDVHPSHEPLTKSPPHPTLSPDGGEGNAEQNSDVDRSHEPVADEKTQPEKAGAEKTGMNITGSLTTAATTPTVPPSPKPKLPAREVQAAPVKNVQPKPPEDSSLPKPSPWDAFSELVQPSPFAPFYGMKRSESWKNKLG